LATPQVLDGFDDAGAPRLRPAKRPMTLKHLLTHTAGFGYETWDMGSRYVKASGIPSTTTAKLATPAVGLRSRREYGINYRLGRPCHRSRHRATAGRLFPPEHSRAARHDDTDYAISPAQQKRLVRVHQRKPDGALEPITSPDPPWREFWSGGGGLYSTARD
jgi:CubicO group peptidase (beta-lactamase class C family)